jgi:formylmethanofuran dehydrogenase subunit E
MMDLATILALSASRHEHLCPRQVLGARMALAAGEILELELPSSGHRLLVICETDGCFLDGLEIAAGVSPGRRTLRVEDYGKVAATFVDTLAGAAVRLAPSPQARGLAHLYAPPGCGPYEAMRDGYQHMPVAELFICQPVVLNSSLEEILSRPEARARCQRCGEEIINTREILLAGQPFCKGCAGQAYYRLSQT